MELCRDELKEGRRIFKRMYVFSDACKKWRKAGYRSIIGLDGYLKTLFKGELLVTLGRDGDEQNETKVNWRWFLTLLQTNMDLGNGG